jgi:hypothetical protein
MFQMMSVGVSCALLAACGGEDLPITIQDSGGELTDFDSAGEESDEVVETYVLKVPPTECAILNSTFPIIKPTTNPGLFFAEVTYDFSVPTLPMFSMREAGELGWPADSPIVSRPTDSGWFFLGQLKAGSKYEYRLSWFDTTVYPWRECGAVEKRFDVPARR